MKGIKEDAIVKISWGILGVMASGLILGTNYVASLKADVSTHDKKISEHEERLKVVEKAMTDIAVIKSQVDDIHEAIKK